MAVFLVNSQLSRGQLSLFLKNDLGYASDANCVKYSIFAQNGTLVSGLHICAIKADVGEYYAPFFTDVPNGSYTIEWEYDLSPCCSSGKAITKSQSFFILDPGVYNQCGGPPANALPAPSSLVFQAGQTVGRGSALTLFLKDSSGLPSDATAVTWIVYDTMGRARTPMQIASHGNVGEYYATWQVCVPSGNYFMSWQIQPNQNDPLIEAIQEFSVLDPNASTVFAFPESSIIPPFNTCVTGTIIGPCPSRRCCSPCRSSCACASNTQFLLNPVFAQSCFSNAMGKPCCEYEIPRVVHLVEQRLPFGGQYTSQPPFSIPGGIRHVSFYIRYARGGVGGFANFKIMWGNGIEETQETLIDHDITIVVNNSLQNLFLQGLQGPVPQDDNPINFIIYSRVPGGATTVRLLAAEQGAIGAPGVISISLTAST